MPGGSATLLSRLPCCQYYSGLADLCSARLGARSPGPVRRVSVQEPAGRIKHTAAMLSADQRKACTTNNYSGLLMAMGDTEEQAVEKVTALLAPVLDKRPSL